MKSILLTAFIFCFLNAHGFNHANFQLLDVRTGLSDNYIQDILHDESGLMWFATQNGLNSYDGYHFKYYTIDHLGAYDNNVQRIWEDASGTIWIKTPVNYCYYNREKDHLENTVTTKLEALGINETIQQLFVDEDQNLWCVSKDSIYYYQFESNILKQIEVPDSMVICDMNCRNSLAHLLLADGSIASINMEKSTIQAITQVPYNFNTLTPHIYIDRDYRIWIYFAHGHEIFCYSSKEKEWLSFPGREKLYNEHCNITTLTDDQKGNIWIGTDNNGVIISQFSKNTYTQLSKDFNSPYSLPCNHITSIYEDENNLMWIGTGKQGVSYTNLNKINIQNHPLPSQEDISSLFEDKKGNLWFGFDGEGIAKYDYTKETYTYFKQKEKSIPSDLIVSSYMDSKDRLWWGSFGGGTFYYKDKKFNIPKISETSPIKELPNYIRKIAEDANGDIWFATYSQGLYRLDSSGNLNAYTTDNSCLLTNYIADLSCKNGQILYIATGSGVYYIDIVTGKLSELRLHRTGEQLLEDNFANCIFQDSRELIWIGGRNEVCIYNTHNDSITKLNTENGLSYAGIKAITEDHNKNIWISTDNGISHVVVNNKLNNYYTFNCYPYYKEDGMGNYTFNNFSIFCNKEGNVLIGGAGGYISINPNTISTYKHNHRVIFTELYLNENRVEVEKPENDGRVLLQKNMQLTDIIHLDYTDNHFSVEVSTMEYGELHKLQYVYRIDKKGKWLKLNENRIYFNKLAPGTYKLEVKVKEHTHNENNPISTLTIHIQPPLWLSVPAYVFYVISTIIVLLIFVKNTKRKHLKLLEQQKREFEIAQRQEMDEAKLRFYTNISHDLRTPLTLIISPLEKLLQENIVPPQIKNELELMFRNSHLLLDVVNQLLDLRRIEKGIVKLNLSYGNLSEFICDICSSFEPYEKNRNIQLTLDIQENELETDFDRNMMLRIMMNLLSNAFKYNNDNGKVIVSIQRIVNENNQEFANIIVSDTGIGIKDENKKKVFERYYQEKQSYETTYASSGIGMHIVKEYVALHDGTICIEDNQPQGTKFIITIPIKCSFKNNSTRLSNAPFIIPENVKDMQVSILIVEDNDDFRHFLANYLSNYFQTFEASNGEQALDILENNEINLAICDVRMPSMSGLELCNRIKTNIQFSHIPVILLTARINEEHIIEGLQEGADEYITKPVNLSYLLLRINKLLEWTKDNHKKFEQESIIPNEVTISKLDNQLITRIIEYININMDNSEFSVEELSEKVGLSRGHLYKKLTSIVGKSPQEFIRIMRIRKGKELLDENVDNISQIAYQIGLSPKLFAKYFKDEYGCSPSTYLKKKNENIEL